LQDKEAVPRLITMLERPDPGVPRSNGNNRLVVRDVVRFNHQGNCLVCHPPAMSDHDPVPGPVPGITLIGPLRSAITGAGQATGGYGGASAAPIRGPVTADQVPLLVRADFVYLRQDFSVEQPINLAAGTNLALDMRFDYLVRTRTLTPEAVRKMERIPKPGSISPQRQALLFTLRQLTGKDAGTTFAQWREAIPASEDPHEVEVAELRRELLRGLPARQMALITEYRDKKGVAYSEALATAIPRLRGNSLVRAREALAERLTRMTAATLRDKLEDDSLETRRAAIKACAEKGEKALVPDLIALLKDPDVETVRLVHKSLKTLTGKDFGPGANPTDEETSSAILAWTGWWKEQAPQREDLAREP